MSGPLVLLRAGGQSIAFQDSREKLPVPGKAMDSHYFNHPAENETALVYQPPFCFERPRAYPPGIPIEYFNASFHAVRPPASAVLACKQDQKTILPSAEWAAFQVACQQAEVDLTQSLQDLEHSWMKGYLLGEEKKIIEEYIRAGLQQVQGICQIIQAITNHPKAVNGQRLQQALDKLAELSMMAAPPSESQAAEINTPAANPGQLTRVWNEVQYFLAPVIVTGWGILNKLGVLTEAFTKNIPIVGGLTSLMLTTYERFAVRINQLKTEDQEKLIAICQSLKAAFEKMEGKQTMEHIQAQTENTAMTFQAAFNTGQKVDLQTQQIIELTQKNEQLEEIIAKQNEKIEAQDKKLDAILALLSSKPPANLPLVEKKA